jgi:predicted transcriptional regulator
MLEIDNCISPLDIRDEKILNLALLGYRKTHISNELGISRKTVDMVIRSPQGQQALREGYQGIDHALMALPEQIGKAMQNIDLVQDIGNRNIYSIEERKLLLDAAKLVLGVAAKFQELNKEVIKPLNNVI